jgi:hypothetical protein
MKIYLIEYRPRIWGTQESLVKALQYLRRGKRVLEVNTTPGSYSVEPLSLPSYLGGE